MPRCFEKYKKKPILNTLCNLKQKKSKKEFVFPFFFLLTLNSKIIDEATCLIFKQTKPSNKKPTIKTTIRNNLVISINKKEEASDVLALRCLLFDVLFKHQANSV